MRTKILVSLFSVALCLSAAGDQEALISDIDQSRTETILTHNQLVANLEALVALTEQKEGDLRPAYETFQKSLAATREAEERTQKRVKMLTEAGKTHFYGWEEDIKSIKDSTIQRRAHARLADMVERWNRMVRELRQALDQFEPLLSYMSDIDTALSYDLTEDGLRSIRGAANSAVRTYQTLQEHVQGAVTELEGMAKELSPVVPE